MQASKLLNAKRELLQNAVFESRNLEWRQCTSTEGQFAEKHYEPTKIHVVPLDPQQIKHSSMQTNPRFVIILVAKYMDMDMNATT